MIPKYVFLCPLGGHQPGSCSRLGLLYIRKIQVNAGFAIDISTKHRSWVPSFIWSWATGHPISRFFRFWMHLGYDDCAVCAVCRSEILPTSAGCRLSQLRLPLAMLRSHEEPLIFWHATIYMCKGTFKRGLLVYTKIDQVSAQPLWSLIKVVQDYPRFRPNASNSIR